MAKEICQECGTVFEAGPFARFCESCRKRRLSETAKARGLNRIGGSAYAAKAAARRAERDKEATDGRK